MRSTLLRLSFATVIGFGLVGCGDDGSTGTSAASNAVCFRMADGWNEAGEFQQNFFVDGEMLPGVRAVELHLSPNYVQVSLSGDIDADTWVSGLPAQVRTDPAITATETSACTG